MVYFSLTVGVSLSRESVTTVFVLEIPGVEKKAPRLPALGFMSSFGSSSVKARDEEKAVHVQCTFIIQKTKRFALGFF